MVHNSRKRQRRKKKPARSRGGADGERPDAQREPADDRGADDLWDALCGVWDEILERYLAFEEKRPVMLYDIHEQRIYAHPYGPFMEELNPKSQTLLADQYERAVARGRFVVFVRDNETKRLRSYSVNPRPVAE